MLACANKECVNYKQELEAGVELCPLCGTKPEQLKAKNNQTLGVIAAIAGFVCIVLTMSEYFYVGFVIGAAGIVLSFISKSKLFIIITIIMALAAVGLFFLFWVQ